MDRHGRRHEPDRHLAHTATGSCEPVSIGSVSRQPRAFFALDFGSATTSAALVGHAGGRWRLLAHAAAPAGTDLDALLFGILDRVQQADPELLEEVSDQQRPRPAALVVDLARLEAHSTPPRRIAVLAGSRRQRRRLEAVATRAGWLVVGASADADDPVVMSRLVLSSDTHAVLLGAASRPARDERRHLPMLGVLVATAARCRPELAVVLAGGAAVQESDFHGAGEHDRIPDPAQAVTANQAVSSPVGRGVLLAPDPESGLPAGAALQQVLEGLRTRPDDSRLGIVRSISSLAVVLDRCIEVLEVGIDGGLRCRAEPFGPGHRTAVSSHVTLAAGSFAPIDPSDEIVDAVLSWSTIAFDRYRLSDRLRDLRISPWGEADGEGALFRLAAAKAAAERLVEATPEISAREMPDILIAAGGVWASTPPSVVALAMADLVRRPGIGRLACDQARLLGPLGTIGDEEERRRIIKDLAGDVLLPLGSLILPSGIRQGRSAGRMRVLGESANSDIDLQPGGIWAVELPPGQTAMAEMDFKDTVRLGTRGHYFSVEVLGGLGGLFVDLRDIPLRMPDRADQKRATWEAWQRTMWSEIDE